MRSPSFCSRRQATLIDHLLHDTGSLPDGKIEELKTASAQRGMSFE
jgi:bifunctional enzyme CysN/CysC